MIEEIGTFADSTVLVVEDSAATRALILKALCEIGFGKFLEADNGEQGLELISRHCVELVISGWNMPKMGGGDFLQHVRESRGWAQLPFLIISASKSRELILQLTKTLAADFLAKPFSTVALQQKVRSMLRRSGANSARKSPILIVDDLASARTIMRRFLHQLHFCNIHEAANGEEALNLLAREHFDLIISDLEMPAMNGLQLLQALRSAPLKSTASFIMVTTQTRKETVLQAGKLGASGCINKPFDLRVLSTEVEKALADIRASAKP